MVQYQIKTDIMGGHFVIMFRKGRFYQTMICCLMYTCYRDNGPIF